jgi:hypothetical protein
MDGERRRDRVRSFVLGGVIGASAAAVAAGRRRKVAGPPPRGVQGGLAAFEDAPCYRERARPDGRE